MKDLTHQKISINPKKTVAQCTLFSKCPQCFFESLTTFILYSLDKLELAQFNFADFLHFSLNFDDISIHRKKFTLLHFCCSIILILRVHRFHGCAIMYYLIFDLTFVLLYKSAWRWKRGRSIRLLTPLYFAE